MKIRRKDAAVRRIAARSMHTNRTRNLFAALAILLAAPESFYAFLRKGGRVQVLHRSRLLAVTINPQSPGGLLLDSLRLQQALEESLQIPVYDVKKIEKVGKNR